MSIFTYKNLYNAYLECRKNKRKTASALEFETDLENIETKAAALTERYNIRFGRMEAVITSLNKTGEYMQSLMDAWNADR